MPQVKAPYDEDELIRALKALARRWPTKTHWLFSASGTLCLMRYDPDGQRARLGPGPDESIDQAAVVETFNIPNDGGDW